MLKAYKSDVLLCLADLSNDEVFTPPTIANRMLDLLPEKIWGNPNIKILDPAAKSGVFLREAAKRMLNAQVPDFQKNLDEIEERKRNGKALTQKQLQFQEKLQDKINHIFRHQLFALPITELTALLTRRSVYCSKDAQNKHSVVQGFGDRQGNMRFFADIAHEWKNDKCTLCGASQSEYQRENGKEQHAYAFIHYEQLLQKWSEIKDMHFDVIIGNPPYQLSDGGGTGDSAKPIYHLFVEQAKKLEPEHLVLLVPSRWLKGGKGLKKFREEMQNDTRLKKLYDFEDAKEVFKGINLDGGVCYFHWDKHHQGKVEYTYKPKQGEVVISMRYLKNEFSQTAIRDERQISIIQKSGSLKEEKFSQIVSPRNPYGFFADLFNNPEKYPQYALSEKANTDLYKVYGVKGKKGGAKRIFAYIDKQHIQKNTSMANKYKLFFSKAYMTTATVPPKIILGKPKEVCTETFLNIGCFDSKEQALNCLSYICTKFFRALLFFNRHSLNISQSSFNLIPLQDFSKSWTDEALYQKYKLNAKEIEFIENNIKEMDFSYEE